MKQLGNSTKRSQEVEAKCTRKLSEACASRTVVVIATDLLKLENVFRVQGDVSSKEAVAAMATAIGQVTKVVDVLINCAGLLKPWRKQCDVDDGRYGPGVIIQMSSDLLIQLRACSQCYGMV